jgi:sialate O-acetylesterase
MGCTRALVANRAVRLAGVIALGALSGASSAAPLGPAAVNLAATATVTASSEQPHLPATAVADGRICRPNAMLGEFGSWAVVGDTAKGQAEISFAWPQPTTVAEVVYVGRCAWGEGETFREYEIRAEGRPEPVARGEFEKRAGPQLVSFAPVETPRLTIAFLSSHGGANPGANEILVFSTPTADVERAVAFAPNSIWSDHAVIQRDRPVRVWGTSADGEEIAVEFRGETFRTLAAGTTWQTTLPPQPAGGPHELAITAAGRTTRCRDVLVGEVWVASGQSNMEMPVEPSVWPSKYDGVTDHAAEVKAADVPGIRMFYVPRVASGGPLADTGGRWQVCSPKTVGGFAAVPYFFGRRLHETLGVPIGLVDCSWGATYIEPWTSLDGLHSIAELAEVTAVATKDKAEYDAALAANPAAPPAAHQHQPTRLFNGMVHRLTPYAIRGAIWYQGEGNVGDGMRYFHKLRALVAGWRDAWGEGQFPFLLVQLAPYDYGMYKGSKDPYKLPALWEAQAAAAALPNVDMATITDVSDVKNIHPPDKRSVGERLAEVALAGTYGADTPSRGPIYSHYILEPGRIRVALDTGGFRLASRDGKPLSWFTIAGADQVFHPAEADIDGAAVVVRSADVPEPKHVRFGWHKLAEPNLANEAGLPAAPFRTDTWTVQTGLDE